jgi:hypothetical protein
MTRSNPELLRCNLVKLWRHHTALWCNTETQYPQFQMLFTANIKTSTNFKSKSQENEKQTLSDPVTNSYLSKEIKKEQRNLASLSRQSRISLRSTSYIIGT